MQIQMVSTAYKIKKCLKKTAPNPGENKKQLKKKISGSTLFANLKIEGIEKAD